MLSAWFVVSALSGVSASGGLWYVVRGVSVVCGASGGVRYVVVSGMQCV